jgi:creatinine amidohydrolase
LALLVAERLDAFVAPTVRIGCSEHHLAFPGTLSLSEESFHGAVADLVRSLARGGFRCVVLLPTHGGNFGPLATALERLGPVHGIEIRALTDLNALFTLARLGLEEHGVPLGEGGVHAGEWETSMLVAPIWCTSIGEPGYTGDPQAAIGAIFGGGVHTVAENGVIGDPTGASAAHGERYWEEALDVILAEVG